MKEKYSSYFLFGLLLGAFMAVVIWYWQKSTAADEGALELLDRMAALERERQRETAVPPATSSDNLQKVRGIGPVLDGRLRQVGIDTFAKLAALSVEELNAILDVGENRAANILMMAKEM
jgi:predicted flap endonuclease-1-like 5' DNA nuclease